LFRLAEHHQIQLEAHYIHSRYNALTDNLSRQKTVPDWHLTLQVTQNIFRRWGTPDIDLFATRRSAVLPVYATLDRTDRQAAFHDAFSRTWNFRLAWIFPPPALIPRVLHHLNSATGNFILIVPRWEKVFWRPDVKVRAIQSPIRIASHLHLVDLTTGQPPANARALNLEA